MQDIQDRDDIVLFVNAFYNKVQQDEVLATIFASRIKEEDWPKHLDRMISFWNTVLFTAREYRGNPFSKHSNLPIHEIHFEKWIGLFGKTIDKHFKGKKAEEAKRRAINMSMMFQAKLEQIRDNDDYFNIM